MQDISCQDISCQDYLNQAYINKHFGHLSACALVAPAKKGCALTVKKFQDFQALVQEFGSQDISCQEISCQDISCQELDSQETKHWFENQQDLVSLAKVLFLNNISSIYCIAPSVGREPTKQDYIDAFQILKDTSGFYSIVCSLDPNSESYLETVEALAESVQDNANLPRVAFVGAPSDAEQAIKLATNTKHTKLFVACSKTRLSAEPDFDGGSANLTAAGLAAVVSRQESLKQSLSGLNLEGSKLNGVILEQKNIFFEELEESFQKPDLKKFVLPKERLSNFCCLKNFDEQFETEQEIERMVPIAPLSEKLPASTNALLVSDFVVSSVMNLVSEIKKRPSFKYLTCSSLLSQIVILLSRHKEAGLIADFLIPEIKIKTDIKILVSVKPMSLVNQFYIDREIVI